MGVTQDLMLSSRLLQVKFYVLSRLAVEWVRKFLTSIYLGAVNTIYSGGLNISSKNSLRYAKKSTALVYVFLLLFVHEER